MKYRFHLYDKQLYIEMKKMKKIKNKGILFWITGLSGSGKTQMAKKISKQISKYYGPTIYFSGDDLRNIFDLKKYTKEARLSVAIKFRKFYKYVIAQNINVIYAVIGMFDSIREWNRKNIPNYVEIYIKSDIKKIIKTGKKRTYKDFKTNIVGLDITPELPKSPNIIIENNFKKNIAQLSNELLKKIKTTI